MRCTVAKVRFDEVKDTDSLCRIHVLNADEATFVDQKFAEKHLTEARKQLKKLRDEAMGIASLDLGEDEQKDDPED